MSPYDVCLTLGHKSLGFNVFLHFNLVHHGYQKSLNTRQYGLGCTVAIPPANFIHVSYSCIHYRFARGCIHYLLGLHGYTNYKCVRNLESAGGCQTEYHSLQQEGTSSRFSSSQCPCDKGLICPIRVRSGFRAEPTYSSLEGVAVQRPRT